MRSWREIRGPSGLLVLAAVAVAGCAAPASEPASGPVARDVERALESGTGSFDHAVWDGLLAAGTRDGLVDYEYMAAHAAELAAYVEAVAAADLRGLAAPELEALLINAYNAFTVRAILDHPGVGSIREIDGVWTDLRWTVGGFELTLDNIEHNILRPFFKDPRIHFAVNCASRSCAPLPPWAFRGPELDSQLERRTTSFLRDPRNVRLDGNRLRVSRYFEWYGDDFTAEGWRPRAESIPAFIARYAVDEVRDAVEANPEIEIVFEDYDWSLNSIAPDAAAAGGAPPADPGVLGRFRTWVAGFGPTAPALYALGYALFVVLLVPGSTLTLGAGLTFGLWLGTAVVILGANVGAALAFLLARYLMRARVERWLARREKLGAIDRAVREQGWRVVLLTRLSPVFPFNVQNYFYGLTAVSFRGYIGASLIGMLPGTLLYVYIGAAGAEVAAAAGGAASWGRTALLVAGLLATLLVVVLVTRVARRELEKATAPA